MANSVASPRSHQPIFNMIKKLHAAGTACLPQAINIRHCKYSEVLLLRSQGGRCLTPTSSSSWEADLHLHMSKCSRSFFLAEAMGQRPETGQLVTHMQ